MFPRTLLRMLLGLGLAGLGLAADPFPGLLPGTEIGGGLPSGYEPSGAVWHPRLERLFLVSDDGRVSSMDADGSTVGTEAIAGDLEAVCVADPATDFLYVGVEHPDSILEVEISTAQVTRSFDLTGTLTGPDDRGLEGLTFVPDPTHPETGRFFAGLQDDGRIYVFELPIASSSTSTAVTHLETITPVAGRDDLSGLHYHAPNRTLYAIYDGMNLLRSMTADGTLIAEWDLPGADQEGVTVTGCGLFVAQDGNGEVRRFLFPVDLDDSDLDGLPACEDNCPQTANAGQVDNDGDGAGDDCDCAPLDAGAFAAPVVIDGLRLSRAASPEVSRAFWGPQDALFDLSFGLLDELRLDGSASDALCLENDRATPSRSDSLLPAAGNGYYYLVRSQNACGTGSYGSDSQGSPRTPAGDCP